MQLKWARLLLYDSVVRVSAVSIVNTPIGRAAPGGWGGAWGGGDRKFNYYYRIFFYFNVTASREKRRLTTARDARVCVCVNGNYYCQITKLITTLSKGVRHWLIVITDREKKRGEGNIITYSRARDAPAGGAGEERTEFSNTRWTPHRPAAASRSNSKIGYSYSL